MTQRDSIRKGKQLSFLLRHDTEYRFDEHGYREVLDLVQNHGFTKDEIVELVETNDKQRYEFNDDRSKIRARQGHSVPINVDLKETLPPDVLFHGTATRFLSSIKENGYKWNAETKTLEKLVTIFKVGDKIKLKNAYAKKYNDFNTREITEIKQSHYILDNEQAMPLANQYLYELAPNKFDITTLKPFDKVLVRQSDTDYWKPAFWGKRITSKSYPFITSFGHTTQAIPFKNNEWLVGTTEDCNDYYKTWI